MMAGVARGGSGSFPSATANYVEGSGGGRLLGASVARNGDVNNSTESVGSRVMGDGVGLGTVARRGSALRKGFRTANVIA